MSVYLQKSIATCQKIEDGEIELNVIPYVDPDTNYLISQLEECGIEKWEDCTLNNQPDWFAYREKGNDTTSLYLKNKYSKNIYFISD